MTSCFKMKPPTKNSQKKTEYLATEHKETHFNLYQHIPQSMYSAIRNENNATVKNNEDNPTSPV